MPLFQIFRRGLFLTWINKFIYQLLHFKSTFVFITTPLYLFPSILYDLIRIILACLIFYTLEGLWNWQSRSTWMQSKMIQTQRWQKFTTMKSVMIFFLYAPVIREYFSCHWYGFGMDLMVWMQSSRNKNPMWVLIEDRCRILTQCENVEEFGRNPYNLKPAFVSNHQCLCLNIWSQLLLWTNYQNSTKTLE